MKEIVVNVTSGIWLRAGEEAVVRRIACIVIGRDTDVKSEQGQWCLNGGGNDWIAGPLEDGKIVVYYRYGGGSNTAAMEGLETFLNWIFAK